MFLVFCNPLYREETHQKGQNTTPVLWCSAVFSEAPAGAFLCFCWLVWTAFVALLALSLPVVGMVARYSKSNPTDYNERMQTIAELPEFIRLADKLLTNAERLDVVRYLAEHPKAGDLMESTGGVRKLRWGRGGQGKSGGVRVIYYFYDDQMPLYLLTLFAKGDKSNLTKAERNELAGLVELLVQIWKRKKA